MELIDGIVFLSIFVVGIGIFAFMFGFESYHTSVEVLDAAKILADKSIQASELGCDYDGIGIAACTGSMRPTIGCGDVVYWINISSRNKTITPGDIILFKNWNQSRGNVVHRILWKNESGYITKGDANDAIDPFIPKQDVFGRVVCIGVG